MTAPREIVVVAAVAALLYLPGLASIPFYTRGEPREALVAREMVRTGEWLVPARPEGKLTRKPPLYYWAAAAALARLPDRPELALRLPSAALGTAAVVATWATARRLYGPLAGLPAALVLAVAFEWVRAATSARVDMALAAALTAVLVSWALAIAGASRRWLLVTVTGAALGTLAKGPVALVLAAATAAAALAVRREREVIRRLRPLPVLATAAALAGAWYAVAFLRQGSAFLDVVARENWLRFLDTKAGDTGHAHTLGYLVGLGLVGLLPWTPLLPLALAPLQSRPRAPATTLLACWISVVFVFFSLASAKRSVYLLPLYPALAILVGAGVAAPPAGRTAAAARAAAQLYAPGLALLAGAAAAVLLGLDPSAPLARVMHADDAAGLPVVVAALRAARGPLLGLALATTAGAVVAFRAASRPEVAWRRIALVVGALAVAWTAAFGAVVHPAIAEWQSLRRFLAGVDALVPADATLVLRNAPEPGLRFYAPRPLRRLAPGEKPAGYLLLWDNERGEIADRPGRLVTVLATSDVVRGRRGRLSLLAVSDSEPATNAPLRRGSSRP
ncbi:MAG TPA: glycosyltransferase family 39 protein [Candidatus Binatia bacterium]|nr:glycosyltransferase family 39 protein [Candidatus Binatia bacterium]